MVPRKFSTKVCSASPSQNRKSKNSVNISLEDQSQIFLNMDSSMFLHLFFNFIELIYMVDFNLTSNSCSSLNFYWTNISNQSKPTVFIHPHSLPNDGFNPLSKSTFYFLVIYLNKEGNCCLSCVFHVVLSRHFLSFFFVFPPFFFSH